MQGVELLNTENGIQKTEYRKHPPAGEAGKTEKNVLFPDFRLLSSVFCLLSSVFCCLVLSAGCDKKQAAVEEPLSMETLSSIGLESKPLPEVKPQETVVSPALNTPQTELKLDPLPPPGPYKPTIKEIQTALKNAGNYAAVIDGKQGPMTKKAIEDFQRANGLEADGKVGLKTWGLLSKYLNVIPSPETDTAVTKKR